jgi:pimeloyl-ACP methyl ester carboxylesterase
MFRCMATQRRTPQQLTEKGTLPMETSIPQPFARALATFIVGLNTLAVFVAGVVMAAAPARAASDAPGKPTIVLVHGAFAESSSWNAVATQLLAKGYPVVAVANPLRGVKSDAAYVSKALDSIHGPIVLVGHSYGGSVITGAAAGKANVKALVYVAGFAPDSGDTAAALASKFPGSTLGAALAPPVPLEDGSKDLYIDQSKFRVQFAADVSASEAKLMAATQRPITEAALNEPAAAAAWKTIPSWFLFGSLDKNIPRAAHAFMAQRAHAKKVVEIDGASHVVMISHPEPLVKLIAEAATQTTS